MAGLSQALVIAALSARSMPRQQTKRVHDRKRKAATGEWRLLVRQKKTDMPGAWQYLCRWRPGSSCKTPSVRHIVAFQGKERHSHARCLATRVSMAPGRCGTV